MPNLSFPLNFVIFTAVACFSLGSQAQSAEEAKNPPGVIAFGSCGREDNDRGQTKIWTAIQGQKPGLFLFLGDNIYGDSDDIVVLEKKYGELKAQPKYREFRESGAVIMGTWDDHDYGRNDAGAEYPIKKESQQAFLDFFDVPKDSPRRGTAPPPA